MDDEKNTNINVYIECTDAILMLPCSFFKRCGLIQELIQLDLEKEESELFSNGEKKIILDIKKFDITTSFFIYNITCFHYSPEEFKVKHLHKIHTVLDYLAFDKDYMETIFCNIIKNKMKFDSDMKTHIEWINFFMNHTQYLRKPELKIKIRLFELYKFYTKDLDITNFETRQEVLLLISKLYAIKL